MEEKTYIDRLIDFAWNFGPKVILALTLLVVGLWIIRRFTLAFDRFLRKRKVDDSLRPFFVSLHDVGLKVLLLLVVASMVGLETTSFIAIFSAIAFSVGLALQGSLGNFASGVLILLFRPYKVGDLLTVDGRIGIVSEIQIFSTVLMTDHGKKIIIPNGKMTEGPIENIVREEEVLVEVTLLLDSETDLSVVQEAAEAAAVRCPWRLKERPSEVVVVGQSRDDIKVDIAWWTTGEHYIATADFIHGTLREEFLARNINIAKERRKENL